MAGNKEVLENISNQFLQINKSLEPLQHQIQSTIQGFYVQQEHWKSLSSQASEFIKAVQEVLENISNQFLQINKSLEPLQRQIQSTMQGFYVQQEHWKSLSSQASEFIKAVQLEMLLQHGWVLSPYLIDNDFLTQKNVSQIQRNKDINKVFLEYFFDNQWLALEKMIARWKTNKLFTKKQKVFKDSLQLLRDHRIKINKNKSTVNICTFIIPALIAQIEGITIEIALSYGFKKNSQNKWTIEGDNKPYDGLEFLWALPANGYDDYPIVLLEEYLFTYAVNTNLYQPKKKTLKLKKRPFANFIRHKIMHGESQNYGTIDNVLRLMLILDFLASIKIPR